MDRRADYLRSVLSAVRSELVPELSTAMARHRADLIDLVVTRLIAGFSAPTQYVAEYRAELAEAIRTVEAPQFSILGKSVQAIGDAIAAEDTEVSTSLREEDSLATAVHCVLQEVIDGAGIADRASREHFVRAIAGAEAAYRTNFEAHVTAEARSILGSGKSANAPLGQTITLATLTPYLQRRFPEKPAVRATSVTPIPGGRSKGTTLVTLEGYDAAPREIILRQDFPFQAAGLPVTYEYPLLRSLWDDNLKIAEPLWLEAETTELGGPFAAFSRSPGKPGGTLFSMGSPTEVARDMAVFFGKLHSVDIDQRGLRDKLLWGNDASPTRAMLDFYRDKWVNYSSTPSALVEAAFLWLYDHLDVIDPEPAFVHGDSSYHNILVHEGRLSAVLDWEYAHAGDPAEDLLGSEHFTTEVLPWDEYIRIYRDNGGREISKGRFDFFALWRSLRFAISTSQAAHVYNTGVNRDLRLATIGFTTTPRLLADVARQLAAASSV